MQYGTPVARRCPKCRKIVLQKVLAKTSTSGAIYFSDSKVVAPEHPSTPFFSRCPYCGQYVWIEELEKVDPSAVSKEELSQAPSFEMMPIENIIEFIDSGYAKTKAQEYKARVALYWNYNDRIRFSTIVATEKEFDAALWKDEKDKAKWKENLDKLYKLCEELTPEETPFFAEILREQGRYEEALAILDAGCEPEYETACEAVRALCEARNRYVSIVKQEE